MNRKALKATGTSNVSIPAGQRSAWVMKSYLLIAACWGILSLIIVLRIYFTAIIAEKNSKLTAEIQLLKAQKKNLEETHSHNRQCQSCERGWHHFQFSCYAVNNVAGPNQITWEEAQNNCRRQNAELVVIGSPEEQEFIFNSSWHSWGNSGYWIGLRVEAGSWKWADGSNLTAEYWREQPSDNACCAISVGEKPPNSWLAVDCNNVNRWICEKTG